MISVVAPTCSHFEPRSVAIISKGKRHGGPPQSAAYESHSLRVAEAPRVRIIERWYYLESYLLAQALREQPSFATEYFEPSAERFNYYAFDLYCEMGPDPIVMQNVLKFSEETTQKSKRYQVEEHIYLSARRRLTVLSGPKQLAPLMNNLTEVSNRLEAVGIEDNIRSEKQRILDTERYVRSEVGNRRTDRHELSNEVQLEFEILDCLSKALTLCAISVGSGAEALTGYQKQALVRSVLALDRVPLRGVGAALLGRVELPVRLPVLAS